MKFYKRLIFFLLACLLSGCASWAQHGVTAGQNKRFRIALAPVEVTAEIDKPSDIVTSPPEVADEKKFIHEQMQAVSDRLTRDLHAKLGGSNYVEVVSSTAPQTLNAEQLAQLKTAGDVQAVLQVKLSGYGQIKKKWLTYLIGSGVVEGVVQGVLASKLTANTWVGVAVALEEVGQEVLVWGGGAYLFASHYAPVTLEAQLISTADGKPIWDDTVFVSVDKDAIEALPEADRKKKEIQLDLTAKKAIVELADDLDQKAKDNLNSRSDIHPTPIAIGRQPPGGRSAN